MYYPLRFNSIYKETVWGGRSLVSLGKKLPESVKIAESWEIAAHPQGVSVISNGVMSGITLTEACRTLGHKLLGSAVSDPAHFPLLIKFIDAHDHLSIQVHPDDRYAADKEHGESGKSEMWYVLSAKPGASLIAGLKPQTTKSELTQSLHNGTCLDQLQFLPVKPGDVINIPPGLVHAIGKGIVICEIQQNADTTYRLYDYNRLDLNGQPRELHLKKALDVIQFDQPPASCIHGLYFREDDLTRRFLILNQYFWVEELSLNGETLFSHDGSRFSTMTVIEGSGSLSFYLEAGHKVTEPLFRGDSLLIPAAVKNWSVSGRLKWLASGPSCFEIDIAALNEKMRLTDQKDDCYPAGDTDLSLVAYAEKRCCISLEPRPETRDQDQT